MKKILGFLGLILLLAAVIFAIWFFGFSDYKLELTQDESTIETTESETESKSDELTEASSEIPLETESQKDVLSAIDEAWVSDLKSDLIGMTFPYSDSKGVQKSIQISEQNLVNFKLIQLRSMQDAAQEADYEGLLFNENEIIRSLFTVSFQFQEGEWKIISVKPKAPLTAVSSASYFNELSDMREFKIIDVVATSVRAPLHPNNYEAVNLYDKDLKTAWVEGASGDGVGESFRVHFESPQKVSFIKLHNGYHKSSTLYKENHRPASIRVTGAYSLPQTFVLEDEMKELTLFLGEMVTDYIYIEILSTYAGDELQDTCISEIAVFGE